MVTVFVNGKKQQSAAINLIRAQNILNVILPHFGARYKHMCGGSSYNQYTHVLNSEYA